MILFAFLLPLFRAFFDGLVTIKPVVSVMEDLHIAGIEVKREYVSVE